MPFCGDCGTGVESSDAFCYSCGAGLVDSPRAISRNDVTPNSSTWPKYFARWNDWTGISGRDEYWAAVGWNVLLALPLYLLALEPSGVLFSLYLLALIVTTMWLGLAVQVRRCRDLEWNPLILLLFLVPIANIVVSLMLALMSGKSYVQARGN